MGGAGLQAVAAEAQARTLAARALKAVRRAQQPAQRSGLEDAGALTGAQVAARAAEAVAGRPRHAGDVAKVWRAAIQERCGKAYHMAAWTMAQKRWAKLLVQEYGWDLVQAVVEAVIAKAAKDDPPTIDMLYAARGRVFDAWQLRGEVPLLRLPRKGAARDEARERKKNFDEWDGPEGGERLD
jgi:hypothetical protein